MVEVYINDDMFIAIDNNIFRGNLTNTLIVVSRNL